MKNITVDAKNNGKESARNMYLIVLNTAITKPVTTPNFTGISNLLNGFPVTVSIILSV